jgi:hypothetical protein
MMSAVWHTDVCECGICGTEYRSVRVVISCNPAISGLIHSVSGLCFKL